MSNFHTTLFKIVLYWCLDLIRHIIGTHLKHNKYNFDISIPFCHHLYLSATLKQYFTEFAESSTVFHHVYMSVRGRIPTCDLIGRLFLGSGLQRNNKPLWTAQPPNHQFVDKHFSFIYIAKLSYFGGRLPNTLQDAYYFFIC